MHYCKDSSKRAMEQKAHLLPTSIFSLFFLATITAVQSITPSSSSTMDFIKESCKVTRFPDMCFSSLSATYTGGSNDLGALTCAAIKVGLTAAAQARDHVATAASRTIPGTRAEAAVKDCVKLTRSAVGQLRKSLDQMKKVAAGVGGRFEISNVQTWMSAGITNQDTCMDGFKDGNNGGDGGGGGGGGGEVEKDVSGEAEKVMKFISNGLALVNSFAKARQ